MLASLSFLATGFYLPTTRSFFSVPLLFLVFLFCPVSFLLRSCSLLLLGLMVVFGAFFLSVFVCPTCQGFSLRVSLPVRFGGFGLRSVVRSSPIAYACSLASAAWDIVAL